MKDIPHHPPGHVLYEEMFQNITDISLGKNISSIGELVSIEKKRHYQEVDDLKRGRINTFDRTLVMSLPIQVNTQEGWDILVDCKIKSKAIKNMMNDDIIQNIRSVKNMDLLDIDFEFGVDGKTISEYDYSNESFYKKLKEKLITFIRDHPLLEETIVNNYCDGMLATLEYVHTQEPIIDQWEKTSREIFISLDMPEDYVLNRHNKFATESTLFAPYCGLWQEELTDTQKALFDEMKEIGDNLLGFDEGARVKKYLDDLHQNNLDIDNIVNALQQGDKEIQLESKFFFLDNGDDLYDKVIEESAYHPYYESEYSIIESNKDKIAPYIRSQYIGMGCGKGKKDYAIISPYIDTNGGSNPFDKEAYLQSSGPVIQRVLLMDGSLKSLSKAEKLIREGREGFGPSVGNTSVLFSQERIDEITKDGGIKILSSVIDNPHEISYNKADLKEASNMFTLLGGTFCNFLEYKKTFLQQIDGLMSKGDNLFISVFNPPKNEKEQKAIVAAYDTPQTKLFISNPFIKLGIPEDSIEMETLYNEKTNMLTINAKIHQKDGRPIIIHHKGKEVLVPDETIFRCITSQRMDKQDMENEIIQSETSLRVIDEISSVGNPFTIYILSK